MSEEQLMFRTDGDFAERFRALAQREHSSVAAQLRTAAEAHLLIAELASLRTSSAQERLGSHLAEYEWRLKNELGRIWLPAFSEAREAFEDAFAQYPTGRVGHVAIPFERLPGWMLGCREEKGEAPP
jgi:hypothetical protein